MSKPVLLLVPCVVHVELYEAFVGSGFLVLDVLLDEGHAGVLFRRMRLMAAQDPAMRSKYDSLRFQYLSSVVPMIVAGQKGVVVVGSHPSDVDLIEYASVAMLCVDEVGLRALSTEVYGEPIMLSTEFALVKEIVAESVDDMLHVPEWKDVGVLLSRHYKPSVVGYARVPDELVGKCLRAALHAVELSVGMLDSEVDLKSDGAAVRVALSFDYLAAIREKWRDAVVGLLGSAPSIEQAFRLPWYVVEGEVFRRMCYRINAKGVPAVSMQGESLVDLVTNRMAGAFTPGELVGTWVGAILCERVTAEQAAAVLRGRSMLSTLVSFGRPAVSAVTDVESSYAVLGDLAWVYSACVGVIAVESEQVLAGLVDAGTVQLPPSVELARRFSGESRPHARVEVAAFMRRVHGFGDTAAGLLSELCRVVDLVNGGEQLQTDVAGGLLSLLPGTTYLGLFSEQTRAAAYGALGTFPSLSMCGSYLDTLTSVSKVALTAELDHMARKLAVVCGSTVGVKDPMDYHVGGRGFSEAHDGYCYLAMFQQRYHRRVRVFLGPYPKLSEVLRCPQGWRVDRCWDVVFVSVHFIPRLQVHVVHFSRCGSVSLRDFMSHVPLHRSGTVRRSGSWRVGATGSDNPWFVTAVISLTVAIMLILMLIGWVIYKCRGQSRKSTRRF